MGMMKMGKRSLILLCIFFVSFLNMKAYAITLDQALQLPGVSILDKEITSFTPPNSIKTMIDNYGIPSIIVDHGVVTNCPKTLFEMGSKKINLTLYDWNLVYQDEVSKEKDKRYWINPEPIMPGEFTNYSIVVFLTSGNCTAEYAKHVLPVYRKIFSNRKAVNLIASSGNFDYEKLLPGLNKLLPGLNGLVAKLPEDEKDALFFALIGTPNLKEIGLQEFLLESRSLSTVIANFRYPVTLDNLTARFGKDYEKTINDDMKNVYRYTVYTKEILNMKATLYIDFIVDLNYVDSFRAYGIRTLLPFKKRTSIN